MAQAGREYRTRADLVKRDCVNKFQLEQGQYEWIRQHIPAFETSVVSALADNSSGDALHISVPLPPPVFLRPTAPSAPNAPGIQNYSFTACHFYGVMPGQPAFVASAPAVNSAPVLPEANHVAPAFVVPDSIATLGQQQRKPDHQDCTVSKVKW
jgi:hypothetical protein